MQLDQGGYEAVSINNIFLVKSEDCNWSERVEVPFSDDSNAATEKLKREIIALKTENARLKQENEIVKKEDKDQNLAIKPPFL